MTDAKKVLGGIGNGLYIRQQVHLEPARAKPLGHVAIPLTVGDKQVNRTDLWFKKVQATGCKVIAWTWFTMSPRIVREAVIRAAHIGAVAFMINGEKELRGKKKEARLLVDVARVECDKASMPLGLVSYSIPQSVRDFPFEVFAPVCDFGQPESYDGEGKYDPEYDDRARAGYIAAGFRYVLDAGGAYVRDAVTKKHRWRREDELERHLAAFEGRPVTLWTLGAKIPKHIITVVGK